MIKTNRFLTLFMLAAILLALGSCSKRVTRMEARDVIDLSGRWNDTDARMVADAMIKDSLSFPWIEDFRGANGGAKPVVVAFGVKNRTAEHINTQIFMKNLERAFLRSGRVGIVADRDQRIEIREERADQQSGLTENPAAVGKELGAHFVLTGVLNSISDRLEDEEVIFYQANLELINVASNQKVWIGEHQIKKFIQRSKTDY